MRRKNNAPARVEDRTRASADEAPSPSLATPVRESNHNRRVLFFVRVVLKPEHTRPLALVR